MHLQLMYRKHDVIGRNGTLRRGSAEDVGADNFQRGLCLPSDNKMTPSEQDRIIEVIRACFE